MTDRELIDGAYAGDVELADVAEAVHRTIALLDRGELRVAQKISGEWVVNQWIKEAILLYFRITEVRT
ncbi:2,3,4,5-tetrahydropyridine-2,6-dicarboxylate N-succinyltransferase, partial [hydrothermal vent metagenome]